MDEADPKVVTNIREYVVALAEMDYPRVWVGKAATPTRGVAVCPITC